MKTPEERRARQLQVRREWDRNNPDRLAAHRAKHYPKCKETAKAWITRNPERYKAINLRSRRKNRANKAAHKKANRERFAEYQTRRRAKTAGVRIEECRAKVDIISKARFCHYCCTPLTIKNRTVDHVTPLSRGGEHCPDNLVAACGTCNSSKGNRLISEWTWKEAA